MTLTQVHIYEQDPTLLACESPPNTLSSFSSQKLPLVERALPARPFMLPEELIGVIVHNLRHDKKALASCSLVAKSWVLTARYHLFKSLAVDRGSSGDGILAFLEFLCTPWGESNCVYIRALRIEGPTSHNPPQLDPILNLQTLGAILHKLHRLDSLELRALAWPAINPDDASTLLTSTSVTSLTLSRISMWIFDSLEQVIDIFYLLPNLKTVRTNEVAWRHHLHSPFQQEVTRRPFPPELQVENIVLRATGITWQFIEISQRKLDFFRSLTSLSIWQLEVTDIAILGRLLLDVSGHLRKFHLKLSDTRFIDEPNNLTPENTWPLLNLRECTSLQSFSLFVPMDDDPDLPGPALTYVPYWESIMLLLAELPQSLCELRFGIEVLADEEFLEELLDEVSWDLLDQLPTRLPQLSSITFFQEDRHEEWLQMRLPRWVRRYITEMMPNVKQLKMLKYL